MDLKLDFASLLRSNHTLSDNMTGDRSSPSLMENLLPMLGGQFSPVLRIFVFLQHIMGSYLGVDATVVLSAIGVIWALNRIGRQVYMSLYTVVQQNFMSTISISSADDIYTHLMRWLAQQPKMTDSRSLMAETITKSAWEEEEEGESRHLNTTHAAADNVEGEYLNFSNQEAKTLPRFVPALGLHNFWYQGTYFRLHRKQQSLFDESNGFATFKDKEDLMVSCLGRSPEPIKRLLQHVKESYYSGQYARTTIKRPSPQHMRRWGGRYNWSQVAVRPVRPMRTVVLDPERKSQVLADMNEYLHPATPRWYANRGIPLRRGYLFHGPPGTGKTSLSFALAGVFGLDIYVISLLEPSLTEEDLGNLFNSLPRRCVVLLEDIDTAGLRRSADIPEDTKESTSDASKSSDSADKTKKDSKDDWKVSDLAKALKEGKSDDKKGISLSGLLNAIDGVASHEGRVLIMTTNKPESLDEALIRPGRVDLQVGFTNATTGQAQELFQRMYEVDNASWGSISTSTPAKPASRVGHGPQATSAPVSLPNSLPTPPGTPNPLLKELIEGSDQKAEERKLTVETTDVGDFNLEKVAAEFAAKIPNEMFSPAEIQGFLLKRKKDPLRALRDTDVWVEAMMTQKESRSKVLKVQ